MDVWGDLSAGVECGAGWDGCVFDADAMLGGGWGRGGAGGEGEVFAAGGSERGGERVQARAKFDGGGAAVSGVAGGGGAGGGSWLRGDWLAIGGGEENGVFVSVCADGGGVAGDERDDRGGFDSAAG